MQMPDPQPVPSPHRILIIDDDELGVRAIEHVMRQHGFADVRTVMDTRNARSVFEECQPDLLLIGIRPPSRDGLAVIRQIEPIVAQDRFLPIIMLAADVEPAVKQKALAMGASDFVAKPCDPVEIVLRCRNLLRLRGLTDNLEERVAQRTTQLRAAEVDMATRLATAAEYRDYPDGTHVQRVGRLSALLAANLGLPESDIGLIRFAAPLHDIGKIAIPDHILLKPAPLTLDELDIMKSHTTIGARMLAGSQSGILRMAEDIARHHHDNWDGTGYTPGLRGEKIPLAGRIVAVADVFDALTHSRPYKTAWTLPHAVEWIQSVRGRKFDPGVIDALLASIDAIQEDASIEVRGVDWSADAALPMYVDPAPDPDASDADGAASGENTADFMLAEVPLRDVAPTDARADGAASTGAD